MRAIRLWVVLLAVCSFSGSPPPRHVNINLSPFEMTGMGVESRKVNINLNAFEMTGMRP